VAKVRLQKLIASAGVASRREAERLIVSGRVSVNDRVVTVLGSKADLECDQVKVDGEIIPATTANTYLMMNKPRGVLTATRDMRGRQTVFDLLDGLASARGARRVFHVGRLDFMSEGLLLLTNDGLLTQSLTHPSNQVPRTYQVKVKGEVDDSFLRKLRSGVVLEDGIAKATRVKVTKRNRSSCWVQLTVKEGRNRLVRRLFAQLGHPVVRLIRVAYGGLEMGDLPAGSVRRLTQDEIGGLKSWQKETRANSHEN
jgi:23S rRNA pseudouridine2605 synthase